MTVLYGGVSMASDASSNGVLFAVPRRGGAIVSCRDTQRSRTVPTSGRRPLCSAATGDSLLIGHRFRLFSTESFPPKLRWSRKNSDHSASTRQIAGERHPVILPRFFPCRLGLSSQVMELATVNSVKCRQDETHTTLPVRQATHPSRVTFPL